MSGASRRSATGRRDRRRAGRERIEPGERVLVLEDIATSGGQALGLEMAGFEHAGLIENDAAASGPLRGYVNETRSTDAPVTGGQPCGQRAHAPVLVAALAGLNRS